MRAPARLLARGQVLGVPPRRGTGNLYLLRPRRIVYLNSEHETIKLRLR